MSGVFFNGRQLITPTTASVVNDDAMRNQNIGVGNSAAFIGRSAGGKPKTALRFGTPQEAQRELISGELLDAVLAAFDPSNETGGPSQVIAIRVNPATQASGVMKDASAATVVNLASTNYGLLQNQLKWKVEAGSLDGLRVTTQLGQNFYTQDNIARRAMSVQYTGAEVSATITVNGTTAVLAAPTGTTVATLNLSEYPTVQDLVDRINAIAGFSTTALDRNGTKATLNALDYVTAQDVKTAAYVVRGDLQAVVDWINSAGEGFLTATRTAGVGTKPAVSAFQFLSGGSDGTTTNTDWADGFEVLQSVDVQWIGSVSDSSAIHAMADAHVAYMSDIGMKERRTINGTALGTSDADAITAAKALNSDRSYLVHLGHYDYDASGQLVLFPPYITAAKIIGMAAGVNPGTPLTNKSVKVRGLERELRNPTDTDVLIQGGVLCLENTESGYKIVKSISTWLTNDNYNRVELSTGVATDFTARSVRRALDVLRGQKQTPLLLSRAISIAESTLRELAKPEPQGPGVLAGDANSPAYRNIKASIVGDVLQVQYECSPVIPNNYVLVTMYAAPFSGTATA